MGDLQTWRKWSSLIRSDHSSREEGVVMVNLHPRWGKELRGWGLV